MEAKLKRSMWCSALVGALACVALPSVALGGQRAVAVDSVLYEVTENMYLFDAGGLISPIELLAGARQPTRRTAVATLQGTANLGTPLCPLDLMVTNPRAKSCTITAAGSDDISLATGQGGVSGTFAVVLNVDNATDAPEYVVMTGEFEGQMDLSTRPLGSIAGFFYTPDKTVGVSVPFAGTFRLPFNVNGKGEREEPKRGKAAFYMDDNRKPFPVRESELSLGWPLVRLEINFQ